MRRIDQNQIEPDAEWDTSATLAQTAIQINGREPSEFSEVWRNAKARLKKLSNGKCWYCEAKQERSDMVVDHFRPKSLYPWWAFKLSNFRYSCTFCNSIRTNPDTGETAGKGDHFPLFNAPRATHEAEINAEDVVLLDPCRGSDPGLLDFREDGLSCPKYPTQPKRNSRAEQSIYYYHLNHPDLVESRRQKALMLKDCIDGADAAYNDIDQGDAKVERAFSCFVETIGKALAADAEFSVSARRVIDGYRDRPWVEDLLQCA